MQQRKRTHLISAVGYAKARFTKERAEWHNLINGPGWKVPDWLFQFQKEQVLAAFEAYRTLRFCCTNKI